MDSCINVSQDLTKIQKVIKLKKRGKNTFEQGLSKIAGNNNSRKFRETAQQSRRIDQQAFIGSNILDGAYCEPGDQK